MQKIFPSDEIKLNSHKHPAYHLRMNKAIDRLLFIDIIKAFNIHFDIQKGYKYIGFGGPYLEDFKLLSSAFPRMEMFSIEYDKHTYKRQQFHKCSKNVKLFKVDFGEFLDETEIFEKHPVIIWLDYTGNEIKHFREIETVSKKLIKNSLVRITLNADNERLKKSTKENFEKIYGEYLEKKFNPVDLITPSSFCELMCQITTNAFCKGLGSTGLEFLPLHIARYRDGQQMVSITAAICQDVKDFPLSAIKASCPYMSESKKVNIIDIPVLTLKERLKLEKHLPSFKSDGTTIEKILGYMIEKNAVDNLRKLRQYEMYYQYYPHFNKIIP